MPSLPYTNATHQSWAWRRYSNTPNIPTGMSHSLYLYMDTLSGGSAQFPLDRLHLCWLFPFNRTEVLLPCKEGEERLETYPYLPETLWEGSEEEYQIFWSNLPVSSHASSSSAFVRGHPDQGSVRLSSCQYPDRGRVRLSTLPQIPTGCQSSQNSTGIWAHPGDTRVGWKVWT